MSIESNTYDSRAPEERNVYGKAAHIKEKSQLCHNKLLILS